MENSLQFIGEVQSELKTIEDCPLQEAENAPPASIKIFPEFLFSTRSPDRPNPIGIHTVKVASVKNGLIQVEALEVLDKTPVIDIKPL